MKADQLMVPVYINEKIVLDMLAIIEDGFSTVSQVSYTEHKENSNSQKLEAGVSTSATLLSKLLKIDLKASCPILAIVEKTKALPRRKCILMYLCSPSFGHFSLMKKS